MQKIILRKKGKSKPEISAEAETIEKLAGYGLSDEAIADVLGVTLKQFEGAKRTYKSFTDALRKGGNKADLNVIESLYQKATGYVRREVEFVRFQGKVKTQPVVKYYPPELNAIMFWLKNRLPYDWKEKIQMNKNGLSEEHLQKLREIAVARMKEML